MSECDGSAGQFQLQLVGNCRPSTFLKDETVGSRRGLALRCTHRGARSPTIPVLAAYDAALGPVRDRQIMMHMRKC